MSPTITRFGATAVPWTVSWTAESETFLLAPCPHFNHPRALSQPTAMGEGKPDFGLPHANRQREAIARGLCDLCGKPLKHSTKISLSQARPQPHGAEGWAILQVEPLLHVDCAMESMRFCPSLKAQEKEGVLRIRQVFRWRAQVAVMSEEYVRSMTGENCTAIGHGKVELIKWKDRDLEWLRARAKSLS